MTDQSPVGIKMNLTCAFPFRIIKEMPIVDRMEAVYIATLKDGMKYLCIAIYNPPNNIGYNDVY